MVSGSNFSPKQLYALVMYCTKYSLAPANNDGKTLKDTP